MRISLSFPLFLIVTLFGCSNNDDETQLLICSTTEEKVTYSSQPQASFTTTYYYQNEKLDRVASVEINSPSDIYSYALTLKYDPDNLIKEISDGHGTYSLAYNSNKLLTKAQYISGSNTDVRSFEYNSNNKLSKVIYADHYEIITYDNSMNITKSESFMSDGTQFSSTSYSYDINHVPYTNSHLISGLYLTFDAGVQFSGLTNNNVLSKVESNSGFKYVTNYSYQYNSSGFPIKKTTQILNDITNTSLSYNCN